MELEQLSAAVNKTWDDSIVERLTAMVGGGHFSAGRVRATAAYHDARPPRHRESAFGLSALRAAVSHNNDEYGVAPVVAGVKNGDNVFPLDEAFR